LIIALNPIMISLLSAVIYKERLDRFKGMGILVSVTGAFFLFNDAATTEIYTHGVGPGELCILGCVASWVAYSLIGKTVMDGLSPLAAVCYSSVVGTAALFFPAWTSGGVANAGQFTGAQWLSLFYLGFFGTVLGFYWYYQGIKKIGPMRASVFINFVPVSAVILAYFILDEAITWSLFVGAVLVVGGVYITTASTWLKKRISRSATTRS
ncbi:MAG: DMT family transporter, partial [Desulfobacterales bacterium]|nr:DMT family transporter [Desulfobacterales bacterium]